MRVLRHRRGFTTNSSSAAEYSSTVPGSTPSPSPTPVGSAGPRPTPIPVGAEIVILPDGVTPRPTATSMPAPSAGGAPPFLGGNAAVLGGVALAVGALVALERAVRWGISKGKSRRQ